MSDDQQPLFERQRDLEGPVRGEGSGVGLGYRGSDGAMTCFLCDTEMDWEDCSACGGDGFFDGYEEDPNWYAPGETVTCAQCGGEGGNHWCPTKTCKTIVCTRIVRNPRSTASAEDERSGGGA